MFSVFINFVLMVLNNFLALILVCDVSVEEGWRERRLCVVTAD